MRQYRKIFEIGFQNALEYRVDFIIGLFSMFFPIFIQTSMWIAIFLNSEKSIIYNYTLPQMLSYVVLAGLISKAMNTKVEYEIMGDIKDGGLNKFIVRPINYLVYKVVENIGGKFAQFLIVSIFIFIGMSFSAALFSINYTILEVVLFIIAIFFSIVLKIIMSVMVSTLSFWVGETWAAFMMLDVIINVMSGGMFPLDIFGEGIVSVLKFLPFQYTIYFPIQIVTGNLEFNAIFIGIIVQIGWILIFGIFNRFIWAKGMKAYISAGG
jgi:ABC-2 type transport system permease protein